MDTNGYELDFKIPDDFTIQQVQKTLDDYELLIKKGNYYFPSNSVYSHIKLKKSGNKYVVINIKDYIKQKTRYNPVIVTKYIDNYFITSYKKYLIYELE